MTRKKFIKEAMATGLSPREAENLAKKVVDIFGSYQEAYEVLDIYNRKMIFARKMAFKRTYANIRRLSKLFASLPEAIKPLSSAFKNLSNNFNIGILSEEAKGLMTQL